jgi:dienelactone hydrolase
MNRTLSLALPVVLGACAGGLCACAGGDAPGDGEGGEGSSGLVQINDEREAHLCVPAGTGPFPVAVYNHGGLGDAIGGPPEDTCEALAALGFLGLATLRRSTISIEGHSEDVDAGIAYVLAHGDADPERVSVLGYSRGGYLSFVAMAAHPDIDLAVIMAPAPVHGLLELALADADQVEARTLVLVAENDLPEFNNEGEDHVATATAVHDALTAAGKESELMILDAFGDNGHDLFQELDDGYWPVVEAFLLAGG